MLLWWDDTVWEYRNTGRETRSSSFLSTTNPTWIVLGSDSGFRGENQPTNHPFHAADLTENIQICDVTYAIVLSLYTVATAVKATSQYWPYLLR